MDVRAFTSGVRQLDCETDQSPPSTAKVKDAWSCTYTSQYSFMVWCA